MTGLPVTKLISVGISLSPPGAQIANLQSMLILGDSDVIDTRQRIRTYASSAAVAADFGAGAPEALAASAWFSQLPRPTSVQIGRWAKTATAGRVLGGALSAAQQAIGNFTGIVNGGFKVQVDGGVLTNVTGINLSAAANLNAVAAAMQAAIQALGGAFAGVTVTWNGSFFQVKSGTTGAASTVAALQPPIAGTDLSPLTRLDAADIQYAVAGIAAESAVSAVTLLDGGTTPWYALAFAAGAANVDVVAADYLAVAAYIEGAANNHTFWVTTSDPNALLTTDTTSIGAQLKPLGYNRTGAQWSAASPYAAISMAARLLTTNFNASSSTITVAFKQEPGVGAENLTLSQSQALDANNYSYYAAFNNNTSIIVNGTVASGQFWDTIVGVDWLASRVQTDVWNLLLTLPKVPQTDAGMHAIFTTMDGSLSAALNNGLLGAGTWTAGGFGQLQTGDFLARGFYIYQPPIAQQAQADRNARKSVPFQIAAKLAGAVQSVNVQISVNQ